MRWCRGCQRVFGLILGCAKKEKDETCGVVAELATRRILQTCLSDLAFNAAGRASGPGSFFGLALLTFQRGDTEEEDWEETQFADRAAHGRNLLPPPDWPELRTDEGAFGPCHGWLHAVRRGLSLGGHIRSCCSG